ncbi:MAG: hypothetical protein RL139_98 [Gemmatimonadota bacterium]
MTGVERDALAHLEVRLFGLDGEGGAIGDINARLQPVTEFYQQALGVMRLFRFLGVGFLVTAIFGVAKASGLL